MRAAVITFPGSNNDDDCRYTLSLLPEFKEVHAIWHKDRPDLSQYQLVWLPGGFSYGDYLRTGAIAAVSPIMEKVIEYANAGGLTLGTCNGFQILCESGLLPGALVRNENLKFICKDIYLKVQTNKCPWTEQITPGTVVRIPIAHGEGRYVLDEADYQSLKQNDQIVVSYCAPDGSVTETSNPNGSLHSIAGVCNKQGNVFGLMPHPERATDLRSKQGGLFWKSLTAYLASQPGGSH